MNALAAVYQPRRVWASGVCIAWNLLFAGIVALLVLNGWKVELHRWQGAWWLVPVAAGAYFALWSCWVYPVELYFGYLEERQFALAKDGIRSWTRDWLIGISQHGLKFVIGCTLIGLAQAYFREGWVPVTALMLLAIFLATTYWAMSLAPRGLFAFESADAGTCNMLATLLPDSLNTQLPPVVIYSAPALRDFAGGLMGLGRQQVLLLSRSTITFASDNLLRFVLLHELGHRRYRHGLLGTLGGWAWICIALVISDRTIAMVAADHLLGTPFYITLLAFTLSVLMGMGEPLLAYLGRRLEYQADRFYIRHGGTAAALQDALLELSERNLARTQWLRRRQTMFHPMPSVANRVFSARRYEESLATKRPIEG